MSTPRRRGTAAPSPARLPFSGRPNVGKSTLLNALVGEKLAIVTPKPQTTRNRIVGVWNGPAGQIVFVDTPGVHGSRKALNRFMVQEALGTIEDVDAALLVVDARDRRRQRQERKADPARARRGGPPDGARRQQGRQDQGQVGAPAAAAPGSTSKFAALVPISALQGNEPRPSRRRAVAAARRASRSTGPSMLTDRTERFLAAELIREQIFLNAPGAALRRRRRHRVVGGARGHGRRRHRGHDPRRARDQKAIVVGKGGSMIREIGTRARAEITELLGRPAHLKLQVKVDPEWTTSPEALARLGYAVTARAEGAASAAPRADDPSLPLVALVGRPNVGKSSLFNRLVGGRPALVEDMPGVTRDRRYGVADWGPARFRVVDTGGLDPSADGILKAMRRQTLRAVDEAAVIVFVLDAKEGVTSVDSDVAQVLRRAGKPVLVAANKVDSSNREAPPPRSSRSASPRSS